MDLQSRH